MSVTQRFSRHGIWPRTVDDILPRGPRETLTSFIFWISRAQKDAFSDQQNVLVLTLQRLILVCRPELVPLLMDDEDVRRRFMDVMCRQLDLAVPTYRSSAHLDARAALACLGGISMLFFTLSSGAGAQHDSWPRLVHGMEHSVLRSLDATYSCLGDAPTVAPVKNALASLQIGIHTELRSELPEYLRTFRAAVVSDIQDPYVRLHVMLSTIRRRVACCAPGCCAHPRAVGPGKLQRCGACRLLQYCSRECQKRHWSAEPLPHKTVCAPLSALLGIVPYVTDEDAFIAACRVPEVPEELVKTLGEYLARDELARVLPPDSCVLAALVQRSRRADLGCVGSGLI